MYIFWLEELQRRHAGYLWRHKESDWIDERIIEIQI